MTTMRERPRKDPRGMTLVELVIGAAIFLVVLLAAYQLFDTSRATYSSGQRKVDVQQNARAAMDELVRQIRVAGYFPENFTTPPPAIPLVNPIQVATNSALAGGIYVKGDASMTLSVQTGNIAQYSITQGSDTYTVQLDKTNNQTKIKKNSGAYTTYTGLSNGLLYVEGAVTSLAGTLQKDTQLTVAATNDVTITSNLVYENYTPASGSTPANAEGTTNLMGILSWNKNIHIGTSAPDDVTIHATLMAPSTAAGYGQVLVDSYDSTTLGSKPNTSTPRGNATVLGGVIMNKYGAFGTVSGDPPKYTGYSRNFVYDKRMAQGMAPPYFPTTGKVVDTLTGLTDRPNWKQL